MIKFNSLPKVSCRYWVACSGGADSIAAADFLHRKFEIGLFYFNHLSSGSSDAQKIVKGLARDWSVGYVESTLTAKKPRGMSTEEFWRNERYKAFDNLLYSTGEYGITAHHLDDCIETYIWTSLNGNGKIIPAVRSERIFRPFLSTRKVDFANWVKQNDLPHFEDPDNVDYSYTRSYIRANMGVFERVNPGISKVVLKKVLKQYEGEQVLS